MMLNCITGSLETTKVLLEAGADKGARNDINRTASQLGAFTGKFLLESWSPPEILYLFFSLWKSRI